MTAGHRVLVSASEDIELIDGYIRVCHTASETRPTVTFPAKEHSH